MADYYHGQQNDVRELTGARRHEVIDASGADANATTLRHGRWFEVDRAGIIKLGYMDITGRERTLVAQVEVGKHHYPNVYTVYKQFKAGSDCTAGVYTSAGDLVIGVRTVE